MFAGWAISTTSGSQTHLLETIENESKTLLNYIRDLNGAYTGVTVYAVYSMKPYRIDTTPQEVENSATSMSTSNGYASKVEKNPSDTTKINPNLENINLINTGLVQSLVQVKASNANPAYLGSITLELKISNSESSGNGKTQDQTDNPYYVFEKVEIYRLGIKISGGCGKTGCTKAGDGYCYHAAMVVLTCNGASWSVSAFIDTNNDSHASDGNGYETPLSDSYYGGNLDSTSNPYYIGKYKTGNDSDNKYNRITVSNKTDGDNPEYLFADVDLNGKVNILDATAIQKYLAKLITLSDKSVLIADTNGDGKVNILDATLIQKILAKIVVID
jgi:hypothetical protein